LEPRSCLKRSRPLHCQRFVRQPRHPSGGCRPRKRLAVRRRFDSHQRMAAAATLAATATPPTGAHNREPNHCEDGRGRGRTGSAMTAAPPRWRHSRAAPARRSAALRLRLGWWHRSPHSRPPARPLSSSSRDRRRARSSHWAAGSSSSNIADSWLSSSSFIPDPPCGPGRLRTLHAGGGRWLHAL